MYTNIDPTEGINTIKKFLKYFAYHIFSKKSQETLLELLNIVMRHCIFKFGNTWWLQNIGTAMGTPVACMYAILFFGYFERTTIQRKYANNLLFYRRQIDDVLGIWIDTPDCPDSWTRFKHDMNNTCKLDWTFVERTNSVNFLDLTISIDPLGNISTKTFQKSMNLFLYIPPHSAHPPGLMKSLVFGLLLTYYKQNTHPTDFLNISLLLFQRLINRGHNHDVLTDLFTSAIEKIENKEKDPFKENLATSPPTDNRIFFHTPFHPKDISRQQIRNIYESTCKSNTGNSNLKCVLNPKTKEHMFINKMTVAYSRPKNLRGYLVPSALKESNDIKVSNFT